MNYVIRKTYDEVAGYVTQVTSIADRNKGALGFLSASVYERMASKGQLWTIVNSEEALQGYLMFGGSMPTLRILQIYVCESAVRKGVGRMLVNALVDHAKACHYHTIAARVASDLVANKFWDRMGFKIHRQVRGGETKKRIINIRGYSLESNDLFGDLLSDQSELTPSGPILNRPVYAIDLNLLIDVIEAREGYKKVIKLMQMGFQGGLTICITPEFRKELERNSDKYQDDKLLRLAELFPELKAKDDTADTENRLRGIIFPSRNLGRKSAQNDKSDLLHLAYCISAGVTGFITSEKALLRASAEIKDRYGISIFTPEEMVLDDTEIHDTFSPLNADFTLHSSPNSNSEEAKQFLNDSGAPQLVMDEIFNSSPIVNNETVCEARLDGRLFAVFFFKKPVKSTRSTLACIYVDETSPKAMAIIDHFLAMILKYKSGFSFRLDLYIGKDQILTADTIRKKGFFKSKSNFAKFICDLFLEQKNWANFTKDINSLCGLSLPNKLPGKKELRNTGICVTDTNGKVHTLSWFEFETLISPRFILNADRGCVLVPIRENYANGLIGNVKKQLSLLSSHEKTLLLEKAYFRSSNKASLFQKGGIIAFYVSGKNSIQEVIGFARITYSDVVSLDEAIIKLDRQGVLSRTELSDLTDSSSKLHVFTFDNFLEFDRRITFQRAKALGLISNANLVSPEKIGLEKFKTLIGYVFDE